MFGLVVMASMDGWVYEWRFFSFNMESKAVHIFMYNLRDVCGRIFMNGYGWVGY